MPVDKMLEGEREKLLQMEQQIGNRVVGQGEAIAAVSNAVRRSRAGLQDPNPANWLVSVLRADRRGQDGTDQGSCRISV